MPMQYGFNLGDIVRIKLTDEGRAHIERTQGVQYGETAKGTLLELYDWFRGVDAKSMFTDLELVKKNDIDNSDDVKTFLAFSYLMKQAYLGSDDARRMRYSLIKALARDMLGRDVEFEVYT